MTNSQGNIRKVLLLPCSWRQVQLNASQTYFQHSWLFLHGGGNMRRDAPNAPWPDLSRPAFSRVSASILATRQTSHLSTEMSDARIIFKIKLCSTLLLYSSLIWMLMISIIVGQRTKGSPPPKCFRKSWDFVPKGLISSPTPWLGQIPIFSKHSTGALA